MQKNLFNLMLYVSFFPQLIAGPIIRYNEIANQINKRESTIDKTAEGIRRFIIGLTKKLIIANATGYVADAIFKLDISDYNFIVAWVGAITYTLQIYYDFSGYSDMAIGMAKIFGFEFRENFNHPYSAKGIKDFWRRWHISLSTWFKEYVYIPLGGNRKGKFRTELNKMIVFFLTGIWHGANWTFVIWGLIHGVANVIEDTIGQVIKIKNKIVSNIITWIVVICAFVMFRADSVMIGLKMLKTMFTGFNMGLKSISYVGQLLSPYYVFIILLAIAFAYPLREKIVNAIKNKCGENISGTLIYVADILFLLICDVALATATYNPFIYFRF